MSFRRGQKVVCIDDQPTGRYLPKGYIVAPSTNMHGLKRGAIYTIRDIDVELGIVVCWLAEIVREYEPILDREVPFAQARFRPLVEKKTDISFAHEILRETEQNAPSKERELA